MIQILYIVLLYFWKKKFFFLVFSFFLFGFFIVYFLSQLTIVNDGLVFFHGSMFLLDLSFFLLLFIFGTKFFLKDSNRDLYFLWSKKYNIGYIYLGILLGFISVLVVLLFIFLFFVCLYMFLNMNFNLMYIYIILSQIFKYIFIISIFSLISIFSGLFISIFFVLCVYLISYSIDFMHWYVNINNNSIYILENVINFVYWIFPSFSIFSVENIIYNGYDVNIFYQYLLILFYSVFMIFFGYLLYNEKR